VAKCRIDEVELPDELRAINLVNGNFGRNTCRRLRWVRADSYVLLLMISALN